MTFGLHPNLSSILAHGVAEIGGPVVAQADGAGAIQPSSEFAVPLDYFPAAIRSWEPS